MVTKLWLIILTGVLVWGGYTLYVYTGAFDKEFLRLDTKDKALHTYVNGVIKNGGPFLLQGNSICWILLHGYTSTPHEMRALGKHLNTTLGHTVYAPLLVGHGTLPSNLLGTNIEDWYNGVVKDTQKLQCSSRYVVGSSLSASIALQFAKEQPNTKGVYLISPFFRAYGVLGVFDNILLKKFASVVRYEIKKNNGTINDIESRDKHITYYGLPLHPFVSSLFFVRTTSSNNAIKEINAPIFIAHSVNDTVASYNKTEQWFNDIPLQDNAKHLLTLEKSNHLLLLDYDRETIHREIVAFYNDTRDISLNSTSTIIQDVKNTIIDAIVKEILN